MARKRALKRFSEKELLDEIARRHADKHFRDGMTMSDMELAAEELKGEAGKPSLAVMLSRMKPEKPTAKACPKCGKRVAVKARDRERTVTSLSGPIKVPGKIHVRAEKPLEFGAITREEKRLEPVLQLPTREHAPEFQG